MKQKSAVKVSGTGLIFYDSEKNSRYDSDTFGKYTDTRKKLSDTFRYDTLLIVTDIGTYCRVEFICTPYKP